MLFDVAGQQVEAAVTSIRRVDWDTMRVNFAILTPAALADMPQSWITSFYLPPGKEPVLPALVREFPNLTVFDVGAILRQLQSVLNEVGRAVQLLFLFTLAAGVLVLAAALTATRDERMREAAVLRALGATRRQLARSQRIELWAVGGWPGCWRRRRQRDCLGFINPGVRLCDYPQPLAVAGRHRRRHARRLGRRRPGLRGVLRTPPLVTLERNLMTSASIR